MSKSTRQFYFLMMLLLIVLLKPCFGESVIDVSSPEVGTSPQTRASEKGLISIDIGQPIVAQPGTRESISYGVGIGWDEEDWFWQFGVSGKTSDYQFLELYGKAGRILIGNVYIEGGIGYLAVNIPGNSAPVKRDMTYMGGIRIKFDPLSLYVDYQSYRGVVVGLGLNFSLPSGEANNASSILPKTKKDSSIVDAQDYKDYLLRLDAEGAEDIEFAKTYKNYSNGQSISKCISDYIKLLKKDGILVFDNANKFYSYLKDYPEDTMVMSRSSGKWFPIRVLNQGAAWDVWWGWHRYSGITGYGFITVEHDYDNSGNKCLVINPVVFGWRIVRSRNYFEPIDDESMIIMGRTTR